MEIIIVLALALLIFGPKRLPEMGRTLGRAAREFRKATDEVKGVFDIGLNDEEDAKSTAGAGTVTAVAPLHTPGHEPWWDEALAAADSPAPAADPPGAETVPGLAGFLGIAQSAAGPGLTAADDDGSASTALASFFGTSAAADDLPAADGVAGAAPETSTALETSSGLEPPDPATAPAPEAPAAEAG